MSDLSDIIDRIPKLDLHLHLDGAVRTRTLVELADDIGHELPTTDPSKLKKYVTVPPDCRSLSEFLDSFDRIYPMLQEPHAWYRIALELCEDLSNTNVFYAETRFAPAIVAGEYSQEDFVKHALKGLHEGQSKYDVTVQLILCLYRGTKLETSLETVELANQYSSDGIVGIDLAGDESKYDASVHKTAFEKARRCGLNITIHAGESGPSTNITKALELGADRIGHGVRAKDDPELMHRLNEQNIPLEVCVTSNLQTQAVASVEEHPVRRFFEIGIRVTINSDDPAVCRTDVSNECIKLHEYYGFTPEEITRLQMNAIDAAFAETKLKSSMNDTFTEQLPNSVKAVPEDY